MYENMPHQPAQGVVLTKVSKGKSEFISRESSDSGVSAYENSSSSVSSKSDQLYYVADPGVEKQSIAVIGSGNFGRSLAIKINQSGYHVSIGSRHPEKTRY